MALTDVFARQGKHTGKPTGDKHADGARGQRARRRRGNAKRFEGYLE